MPNLKSITVLAFACLACALPAHSQPLLYRLESTTTLPSTDTGWDYIKMEPGSSRLYLARAKDALTVVDIDTLKVVKTVANSEGANGPLLLPQYDRGYVAMTDGSLLSFRLDTLEPIARIPLSTTGGLNSGVHDPATRRVHFIEGTRPDESTWFTLDAATGKSVGSKVFPFRKMDDPALDGKGRLFAPVRYDDLVLVLDSKTLEEKARWNVGCHVSKVNYQASTQRLLAACGGDTPQFLAIDPGDGRVIARLSIGPGLDGFVVDEKRHRIVTSNGADGTLTVIGQQGPDDYALLGTVSTRLGARMMTLDPRDGRLLVVNADYTLGPIQADGSQSRTYHPDSFVVLTYRPDDP
ncbi:MAG: YncE family protein [Pseudoxanthomonas sp.]